MHESDSTPIVPVEGSTQPPEPQLKVALDHTPTVNLAMQQNDVPIVRDLRIENISSEDLQGLRIRIWTEPEFAIPWEGELPSIRGGQICSVSPIDLLLAPSFLQGLHERVAGVIHVQVTNQNGLDLTMSNRIELLACDEWGGLQSLPEILAAFVLPNHPSIEGLLSRSASILEGWTQDGSLSGYQSRNPDRVLKMAAAVYATLQERRLRYINPPASFESSGQKIRLPDRILEHGLATCLDLTTLLGACLEQAGLHPLLVLTRDHAFLGVWLEEECFADAATDDLLRLRKRVDLGEICVFESTLVTASTPVDFSKAVEAAQNHLLAEDHFACVIDVHRARRNRIRPLPFRVTDGKIAIGEEEATPVSFGIPAPPDESILSKKPSLPAEDRSRETPATRLDRWKRKLLDLSLHNRLLNFRESRKTLRILCPDLASLEDALATDAEFQVLPRPVDPTSTGSRSSGIYTQRTGSNSLDELLREEFKSSRLYSDIDDRDLQRRVLEIYREARTSLEEGGANILYLALGFLVWTESPTASQTRLAPIVLVPVELNRASVQQGFRIRQGDEEPRINTTLLELLATDYGITLPPLDPLPADEKGIDLPAVFSVFRQAIRDVDRWDVVEIAQVGLFSFTKFLMWRDLQDRSEDLCQNKVVNHLINNPMGRYPSEGSFPDSEQLDKQYHPKDTFCPLSSDSSQLAAVYATER